MTSEPCNNRASASQVLQIQTLAYMFCSRPRNSWNLKGSVVKEGERWVYPFSLNLTLVEKSSFLLWNTILALEILVMFLITLLLPFLVCRQFFNVCIEPFFPQIFLHCIKLMYLIEKIHFFSALRQSQKNDRTLWQVSFGCILTGQTESSGHRQV